MAPKAVDAMARSYKSAARSHGGWRRCGRLDARP
jgi:hypothetical protein